MTNVGHSTTTYDSMFAHALDFAARGLPVFPCGKKARRHWSKRASKRRQKIPRKFASVEPMAVRDDWFADRSHVWHRCTRQ